MKLLPVLVTPRPKDSLTSDLALLPRRRLSATEECGPSWGEEEKDGVFVDGKDEERSVG